MWKNRGPWVAVAIIVVVGILLAGAAFAQGDGKRVIKGKSCCSDRQIAASASQAGQAAEKAPGKVAKKDDCCKALGKDKAIELCTHCGYKKGSGKCCSKDMVKCEKCGLAKGSPGCCLKADHVCTTECKPDCKKTDCKKDVDKK